MGGWVDEQRDRTYISSFILQPLAFQSLSPIPIIELKPLCLFISPLTDRITDLRVMFRKFFSVLMAFVLLLAAYSSPALSAPLTSSTGSSEAQILAQASQQSRLSDGTYPVQQATYDDGDGTYSLMLLNTAPGESSIFRTTNLPMARLTDEEIASGQKSYLKLENNQPSLHLTEDFKIEYVHAVTEAQVNPNTGDRETVVVRHESSFWTPFAGALAGQTLGSLLFTPHYYFPPVYQPGMVLTGYGGYGRTYNQAVKQYQSRYQAPPAEVRNRQFRTTGRLRSPSSGQTNIRNQNTRNQRSQRDQVTTLPRRPKAVPGNRPSGSGYGTSTLRRSNPSASSRMRKPSRSFGSSRSGRVSSRRR